MKQLLVLAVSSTFYVINSAIVSKVLGAFWDWFLAAQYGAGPSAGAWFGISAIAGLILGLHRLLEKKEHHEIDTVGRALLLEIGFLIGIALLVGMVAGTGTILGWM